MKKILLTLAILPVLGLSTPALANHADGLAHDSIIKVNGMVCDFCAQSIKKMFGKEDAVEGVFVDLDNGEIIVDYKEGQTISDEKLTKLVVDSGYSVTEIINETSEVSK